MNDRSHPDSGQTALKQLERQYRLIEEALYQSEKRYRLLAENAGDAIWTINLQQEPTYISPSIKNLLGYSAEEVMAKKMSEIFSPASMEYVTQILRIEIEKTEPKDPSLSRSFEVELIHKDGSTVPVELTCKFLLDDAGNATEIITSAHNISDRRQIFDRLKQNEEKYRNLIENLKEAIYCIDVNGLITYISPTIHTILGYTPEEGTGKYFWDYIHSDDKDRAVEHFKTSLKRAVEPIECRFLTKAGDIAWFYCSSVPVIHGDKVAGIQGILLNITDYKRREKELTLANEKLLNTISSTIQVIASIIELKDSYTAAHQLRVTKLACAIGRELNMTHDQIDAVRAAGLVHDIGKLSIPVRILNKNGAINQIEYEMIKRHPLTGYELLKPVEFPWPVAEIVLQHHERLDGSGYPHGLTADEILPEAKVLAVADVVEAISARRPYHEESTVSYVLEEISKKKGILYDSNAVEACLRLFIEKKFTFL